MWPRRKADRLLEDMIRENKMAGQEAVPRQRRFSLFGRSLKPVPFTAQPTARSRDRRSDLTVAALGVTLGLICALFPWYIFFNPEEFGVRAMKFGGSGGEPSRFSRRATRTRRRARWCRKPASSSSTNRWPASTPRRMTVSSNCSTSGATKGRLSCRRPTPTRTAARDRPPPSSRTHPSGRLRASRT